jgi:hypothetical protein
MATNNLVKPNPASDPLNDPLQKAPISREGNFEQPDIISSNQQMPSGRRTRQLIRWRVPSLGFVDMYINPQQLVIAEKKVIQKQRTKGGYIIQYWGEEAVSIRIEGNTGASGVEGINILRKVYRAEQDAFQQVAQTLAERNQAFSSGSGLVNLLTGSSGKWGSVVGGAITGILGGASTSPLLPTLGSLATSVELYYQGVVYKGYFESFSVTESVAQGVGIFTYTMDFTVLDRRGIRTNFMPWHRIPAALDSASGNPIKYYNSDNNSTPLNFKGEE